MTSNTYQVWQTEGTPGRKRPGPHFRRLRDALAYIEQHDGVFEIRLPNGKWLPIDNDQRVLGEPLATPA